MTNNKALLIFVKSPHKGKAKTRIAHKVGVHKAKEIYIQLLDITRKVALQVEANRYLFYVDEITHNDEWNVQYFNKHVQVEGDLGAKMLAAFTTAFHANEKVIIIGSDCPYITPDLIEEAYSRLDQYDYVFGPADDGGYYLCGMKAPSSLIFEDMPWSTDQLLTLTLSRLDQEHKSSFFLPTLSDIDYIEDWNDYLKSIKQSKNA